MITPKTIRQLSLALFILYVFALIYVIFLERTPFTAFGLSPRYNLVPFHTISNYLNDSEYYNASSLVKNLLGNIILLVPFAVLAPLIWQTLRKPIYFVIALLAVNLLIEVTEYSTALGSFDIDDIILNTTGALLVYCVMLFGVFPAWRKAHHPSK